ncbi:hypothetical protein DR73_1181 [Enterobacteriaceae bacterium ATCC 29904]|nr:hypothetical protein DR73_1181 [Enterobacteriaceae bacterium ATCC 29904]
MKIVFIPALVAKKRRSWSINVGRNGPFDRMATFIPVCAGG